MSIQLKTTSTRLTGNFFKRPANYFNIRIIEVRIEKNIISYRGIGMVPSIIDTWGFDREFCSSSS
jgi:hypothetical protein